MWLINFLYDLLEHEHEILCQIQQKVYYLNN